MDWYAPGFRAGGPISSVVNMVNALKSEFEFYILTSAYDMGVNDPYTDVILNQWHDQEGVYIKYLTKKLISFSTISANIKEVDADVLYINNLYSRYFAFYPLLVSRRQKTKIVVAPRGILNQGALGIKKTQQKGFIRTTQLLGWYHRVVWHASSPEEKAFIKQQFGRETNTILARNIPVAQQLELDNILNRKITGKLKIVSINRIARKKNLHLAVDAFQHIQSDKEVEFEIYGNIEDQEYFDSFKEQIKDRGNIKMSYKGVLNPNDVSETYAKADFMILPSQHENYGHAIVESWSNGCPVIISKNTPWKNLRVQDLGWDVDINQEGLLTQVLQEAVNSDFTSYIQMARACYNYFSENICDDDIIEANRRLFS